MAAWFCRIDISSGIFLCDGVKYTADDTGMLCPQPGPDSADFKQCASIPLIFSWREVAEPSQEHPPAAPAPVVVVPDSVDTSAVPPPDAPVDAPAAPPPATPKAPKAPKKSKLIGG